MGLWNKFLSNKLILNWRKESGYTANPFNLTSKHKIRKWNKTLEFPRPQPPVKNTPFVYLDRAAIHWKEINSVHKFLWSLGGKLILFQEDENFDRELKSYSQASMDYVLVLQEVQERKKYEFVEDVSRNNNVLYHQG